MKNYGDMSEAELLKTRAYWFFRQYAYFNEGLGKLSILRYSMFGAYFLDFIIGLYFMLGYGVVCYIVGFFVYKLGLPIPQAEVGNQFNLLAKELRKTMKVDGVKFKYK